MKQLVILSGKGGTGKTSIAASFAALCGGAVLADCDVDAANLDLLLQAELLESEPFVEGRSPLLDANACIECGLCREVCRFEAIDLSYTIDPFRCEGCGFCARVCPEEAIEMSLHPSGTLRLSRTPYGPLVHAELDPGEEYSGKLITRIRERARNIAQEEGYSLVIGDGPPGIGCPVIATATGADLALIVTEPSLSGVHDLKRILQVTEHFGTPTLVTVNKFDIDVEGTGRIDEHCVQQDVPVVGRIPFDPSLVRALVNGRPPVVSAQGPAVNAIQQLWQIVAERLNAASTPDPIEPRSRSTGEHSVDL